MLSKVHFLDTARLGFSDLDPMSFLESTNTQTKFLAITQALIMQWPNFNSPKYFQSLRGELSGFQEIRIQDGKNNIRFFTKVLSIYGEALLIIAGGAKLRRTGFDQGFYLRVLALYERWEASPQRESYLR